MGVQLRSAYFEQLIAAFILTLHKRIVAGQRRINPLVERYRTAITELLQLAVVENDNSHGMELKTSPILWANSFIDHLDMIDTHKNIPVHEREGSKATM